MPTPTGIVRNDVDALIETQVANEIFEGSRNSHRYGK